MNSLKLKLASGAFAITSIFIAQAQTTLNTDRTPETNVIPKTEDTTQNIYSVGLKDMREHKDLDFVKSIASQVSKKAIVVLYMGNNVEFANKVREGASQAKNNGAPVRGMIMANADDNFHNGKDSFIILVDAFPAYGQAEASKWPLKTTKALIEESLKDYAEYLPVQKKKGSSASTVDTDYKNK